MAGPFEIFLSYSRDDQATARRFAEAFEREGFSVWWDQTLNAGENYDQVTERALREARAVVVLWSKTSVDSRWVRAEATQADRLGTLVPVMIEPCVRPIMFELKHTADLSQWKGDASDPAWKGLLASLRRYASSPDTGHETSAPVATASPVRRLRWAWPAGIAAALLLLGGAIFWLKDQSSQLSAEAPADTSIAVLPFTNMSSDKEQEYFSDGLTEELLNQLAQVPQLRVIGRTSSFAFKGRNEDLRKIGEMLGVNHILEGSVRKAGDRIRITAQLIDPADGSHLWSETYERRLDDIFAIQDEIARAVTEQLQLKMGVQGNAGGTTNVAAFDEFLAGREMGNPLGSASVERARLHFERAVELDPDFLEARLMLVDTLSRGVDATAAVVAEAFRQQDVHIDEIVRAAPGSPEASLALSYRAARSHDLQELERLLRNALNVSGRIGTQARLRYGQFLLGVGQLVKARVETEAVLKNDPLDPSAQVQLVIIIEAGGDFDETERQVVKLRDIPGGDPLTKLGGWINLAQSRRDVAALRNASEDVIAAGGGILFLQELLKARMEDYPTARRVIREQIAIKGYPEQGVVWPVRMALWAEFFEDRELARDSIARLLRLNAGFETLAWDLWRPVISGLRGEPEFRELLRKLGLVDYWRATGNWGDFCKPVGNDDFECR